MSHLRKQNLLVCLLLTLIIGGCQDENVDPVSDEASVVKKNFTVKSGQPFVLSSTFANRKFTVKGMGEVQFFIRYTEKTPRDASGRIESVGCVSHHFGWALIGNCIAYGSIWEDSCTGVTLFTHHNNVGLDHCFGGDEWVA